MKGISKEFKIGSIVLVSIVLLFLGINYLKGLSLFLNQRTYYGVYENVDGLGPSNPVILNGFKVGQVRQVGFHSKGDGSLVVAFNIDQPELRIPQNSTARIFSSDLFGSKAIELIMGDSSTEAEEGDTLISEVQIGIADAVRMEMAPLKQKTDQLIESVDVILENLQAVFESDATKGLPQSFEALKRTLDNLEQTSGRLDRTIAVNTSKINSIFRSVDSIAMNLQANSGRITKIIENAEQITDSLALIQFATTFNKADRALEDFATIMEKINEGDGSLSLLLNSDSLHQALIQTNEEVQFLIDDLYMNPWKYVHVSIFGKKPKEKFSRKELKQIRSLVDDELNARDTPAKN